ncbi:tetratricopeptide repeat protein, partial [candidate division WOR-3 bacterium]|nr:tetratricopeptide repeat protein [candidate division WOR-3 bacterium]
MAGPTMLAGPVTRPAQPPDDDSIRRQLAAAVPAERIPLLLGLARKLWLTEPAQARPLLEQALADAATTDDMKARAKAASMLSELCRKSGDAAASERYCREVFAAASALGDPRTEATGHNLLGMLMQERGSYPEALASFRRCLELGRRTGYAPAEQ